MSIFVLIPVGVALILYLLFLFWYGGRGKPLTNDEVEDLILTIKKNAGIENEPDPQLLKNFRELAKSDDGKEFFMVNLMKFKDNTPGSEAMKAHDRYSKIILPLLLKNGSFPIFASTKSGRFITPDSADEWDKAAMVRYRSRRDMFNMVVQGSKTGLGENKWKSMEKTYVFPVKSILRVGLPRIGVLAFFTLVVTIIALFM